MVLTRVLVIAAGGMVDRTALRTRDIGDVSFRWFDGLEARRARLSSFDGNGFGILHLCPLRPDRGLGSVVQSGQKVICRSVLSGTGKEIGHLYCNRREDIECRLGAVADVLSYFCAHGSQFCPQVKTVLLVDGADAPNHQDRVGTGQQQADKSAQQE